MTQNTEQKVRTREETAAQFLKDSGYRTDHQIGFSSVVALLLAYAETAEARGAEEQRRKDAEGQEPIYQVKLKGGIGSWQDVSLEQYRERTQLSWLRRILFPHPPIVAALEAEIASLKMTQAHNDGVRNEKQSCINALEAVVRDYQKVIRHIVWTASEYGLGKRGHESAVDRARAALTREGGV